MLWCMTQKTLLYASAEGDATRLQISASVMIPLSSSQCTWAFRKKPHSVSDVCAPTHCQMHGNKNRPTSILDTAYVSARTSQPRRHWRSTRSYSSNPLPLSSIGRQYIISPLRNISPPRPSATPQRTSRNQSGLWRALDGRCSFPRRIKRHRAPTHACSVRSRRSELS